MKTLLRLQDLDLKIEACKAREAEIPKQKSKFEVQRKRLLAELGEREEVLKQLQLEQRSCEGEIEQKQAQAQKYDSQLFAVKKNEEYQALLHEIDVIKKGVAAKEERIIAIMLELDDAKARLAEDRKRIEAELAELDRLSAEVDHELDEAVAARKQLEADREPVLGQVPSSLLQKYQRIRASKRTGPALVPLRGETCSGCNMSVPPQVVNEVLDLEKNYERTCAHCGRLLYNKEGLERENADIRTQ